MSQPFVGQLLLVGFNYAPYQWALAAGQLLPISSNPALFTLLRTYYGGNGTSNFALPNLQGCCAVGMGQGPGLSQYDIGETGGSQTVTLSLNQIPVHTHAVESKAAPAIETAPAGNSLADSTSAGAIYYKATPIGATQQMAAAAITPSQGGGMPHNNMMPFQTLNWVIALQGIPPQRP
jgi:microcystin-dependent protein